MKRSLSLAVIALALTATISGVADEVVNVEESETVVRLYDQWRFQDADRMLAELEKTHPGEARTLYARGYERFLSGDYPAAWPSSKPPKRACRSKSCFSWPRARRRASRVIRNGARRTS